MHSVSRWQRNRPYWGSPRRHGSSTTRLTTMELVPTVELQQQWSGLSVESVIDRHYADGRLMMSVERADNLGSYRIYAPHHGRHIISSDGTRLYSALPRAPAWRWQRLLFAQVLPLAASLQGLSPLHASAVAARRPRIRVPCAFGYR